MPSKVKPPGSRGLAPNASGAFGSQCWQLQALSKGTAATSPALEAQAAVWQACRELLCPIACWVERGELRAQLCES